MKFTSTTVLLLAAPGATAFMGVNAPRAQTTALFGFKQGYQYNLEQLTRTGMIEVNGEMVNWAEAQKEMADEFKAAQEKGKEAQARVDSIEGQISANVQEQQETVEALKAEIQKQQEEMAQRFSEVTEEATQAKINAQKEAMAVVEEYKTREQQLLKDMEGLQSSLSQEQGQIQANKDVTNGILATRIELDQELGSMKKQYENDSKEWLTKLEAEQSAHENDVSKAEAEVARLKKEVEAMEQERTSLSSLFKQTFKVMFGYEDE